MEWPTRELRVSTILFFVFCFGYFRLSSSVKLGRRFWMTNDWDFDD